MESQFNSTKINNQPETSGTAFFEAMAYSMRTGIVTVKDFKDPLKAWNALTNLVKENNRLGYVQGVGLRQQVKEDGEAYYGDGAFVSRKGSVPVFRGLRDYHFSSTPSEKQFGPQQPTNISARAGQTRLYLGSQHGIDYQITYRETISDKPLSY